MTDEFDIYGMTHTGLVRKANEDQFLIATLTNKVDVQRASPDLVDLPPERSPLQGELLVVADGIGGGAAGEIASREAIRGLMDYVQYSMYWHLHERERHEQQLLEEFSKALTYCQDRLQANVRNHPERKGMGTTLTAAYIAWPKAFVLHAGDSRCYRLRSGKLQRVTKDHTMAQRMVETGALPAEQAEKSPWSRYVWNAVGGDDHAPVPELTILGLKPGDSLLLCSDGLTKHMAETDIANLLSSRLCSAEICRMLIEESCRRGGTDNITVVLGRFTEAKVLADDVHDAIGSQDTEEMFPLDADLVPGAMPATGAELARAHS